MGRVKRKLSIPQRGYESAYALLEGIGKNDVITANKYDRAIDLIDSGDYKAAYALLDGLSYKDSAEKLQSIKSLLLTNAIPGDTVFFGEYEQDNDTSNGKESIAWLVLDNKDVFVLVIRKYILEDKPFGTSDDTWETCFLRKWLNSDFINAAFGTEDQNKIQSTYVTADKNPYYNKEDSGNSGNATTDKVFLLSVPEAEKYFSSSEAKKAGKYDTDTGVNYQWWLRTSGYIPRAFNDFYVRYGATLIGVTGAISNAGNTADTVKGVRPAMWISIK